MNVMTDLIPYYGQPELAPLVAELIAATKEIDKTLERQERAIRALAEGWSAIEAKRAAAYEAAEQADA